MCISNCCFVPRDLNMIVQLLLMVALLSASGAEQTSVISAQFQFWQDSGYIQFGPWATFAPIRDVSWICERYVGAHRVCYKIEGTSLGQNIDKLVFEHYYPRTTYNSYEPKCKNESVYETDVKGGQGFSYVDFNVTVPEACSNMLIEIKILLKEGICQEKLGCEFEKRPQRFERLFTFTNNTIYLN